MRIIRKYHLFQSAIVLLLSFIALFVQASPLRTTYQAKIIKPDGYPLEATSVNFKFTILDPAGSCILFSETYSSVNMNSTGGLISFSLGSGIKVFPASATTFADVFSNITPLLSCDAGGPGNYSPTAGDIRKLVVQFHDGNGWQTLPAMNINAVPYAMYANEAQKLNGLSATDFVQTSAIPTCVGGQALYYNGTSFSCVAVGGGGVTSATITAALGYAPADGASITALTSNFTSVSSTVFSVSSTVSSLSSTVSYLAAAVSSTISSQWVTSGTNIHYASGNVGIGTSSPTNALHIVNTTGGIVTQIESNPAGLNQQVTLNLVNKNISAPASSNLDLAMITAGHNYAVSYSGAFGGGTSLLALGENYVGPYGIARESVFDASLGASGLHINNRSQGDTRFSAGSAERMRIARITGYVGIGTSTPVTRLDVAGGIRISMESATCAVSFAGTLRYNSGVVEYCNGTSWGSFGSSVTSASVISALGYTPASSGSVSSQWATSATSIYYESNVGIGTSNPAVRLDVNGQAQFKNANTQIILRDTDEVAGEFAYIERNNTALMFGTNNGSSSTVGMVIKEGRVGIGTSAPQKKLHINNSGLLIDGGSGLDGSPYAARLIVDAGISTGHILADFKNGNGSVLTVTGSNVGIGVSSPQARLDVNGSSVFRAAGVSQATWMLSNSGVAGRGGLIHTQIAPESAVSGSSGYKEYTTGTGSNGVYYLGYVADLTNPDTVVNRLTVGPTGLVGIGTNTPITKLEVNGTISSKGGDIILQRPVVAGGWARGMNYTPDGSIDSTNDGIAGMGIYGTSVTAQRMYLSFGSSPWASVSGIQITANGNVGIGTLSPMTRLEVSGGIRISMEAAACAVNYAGTLRYNAGVVEFCNGTTWSAFGVSGAGLQSFNGSTSATQTFAYGNTGTAPVFATANGVHTLNIPLASTGAVTAGLLSNADYVSFNNKISSQWSTSGTTINYMTGSVGIGTINPGFLLDLTADVGSGSSLNIYNTNMADGRSTIRFRNDRSTVHQYELGIDPGGSISKNFAIRDLTASGTPIRFAVASTGNVGIGTAAPTAKLHLTSGTSLTASLKLTSGTLLTSAQSGTIEYDGFNYYITDGSNIRRAIATESNPGLLDNTSDISNSGNITLTPTGSVVVSSTTSSTNPQTGALVVKGGIGIASQANIGGALNVSGVTTISNIFSADSLFYLKSVASTYSDASTAFAAGERGLSVDNGANTGWSLAKFRNSSGTAMTISGSGNVAIGTASSTEKLHVVGKGVFESAQVPGINEVIKLVDSANVLVDRGVKAGFYVANGAGSNRLGAEISAANEASLTSSYLTFNTETSGTVSEKVRISGSGNVGIGTSSPLAVLQVTGLGNGARGLLNLNSISSSERGTLAKFGPYTFANTDSPGSFYWNWGVRYDGEANQWVRSYTTGSNFLPYIKLATNSKFSIGGAVSSSVSDANPTLADKFTVDLATGNVGIGTNVPNSLLQVNASSSSTETVAISFHQNLTASSGLPAYGIGMGPTASQGYMTYRSGTSSSNLFGHKFYVNDNEIMRIRGDGSVGIGTSTPTRKLEVHSTTASVAAFNTASADHGYLEFYTDAASSTARTAYMGYPSAGGKTFSIYSQYASGAVQLANASGYLMLASTGNVGIGITPAAKLHLTSGTANTASFKLTSGTLLTSPQAGAIEYDGFNYYITDGASIRRTIATATSSTGVVSFAHVTGDIKTSGQVFNECVTVNEGGTVSMTAVSGSVISEIVDATFVDMDSPLSCTNSTVGNYGHRFCNAANNCLGQNSCSFNAGSGDCGSDPASGHGKKVVLKVKFQNATYAANNFISGSLKITSGDPGINKILTSDASGNATWQSAGSLSPWQTSGANIYYNTGNVGIGSSITTYALSFGGNTPRVIGMEQATSGSNGQGMTLRSGGAVSGVTNADGGDLTFIAGAATGTGTSDIIFQAASGTASGASGTNPTTKMIITGSGKVGIGTITDPGASLHISGTNDGAGSVERATLLLTRFWGGVGSVRGGALYNYTSSGQDKLVFGVSGDGGVVSSPALIGNAKMVIQANGNVGVGTTTPATKLDVVGAAANTTFIATFQNQADSGEIIQAKNHLNNEVAAIRTDAGGTGFFSVGDASGTRTIQLYGSNANVTYFNVGNVGIGTITPSYKLDVAGTVNIASGSELRFGGTTICTSAGCTSVSDKNLKENIQPLDFSLNKILALQGVQYDWKDKFKYGEKHQIGFLAQDLEKFFPEVVYTDRETQQKSVSYGQLIAPLIEAFKAFHKTVMDLFTVQAREMASLKKENEELKQRLDKLEQVIQRIEAKPEILNGK